MLPLYRMPPTHADSLRAPNQAHSNGGRSRSMGTVSGPTKVLALWIDGPPYPRSRQHYGYVPRCVRQPLPRLRFVGGTAWSVETAYPCRHVFYCFWNRLRPRPWFFLWSGRRNCDRYNIVSRIQSGSSWARSLFVALGGSVFCDPRIWLRSGTLSDSRLAIRNRICHSHHSRPNPGLLSRNASGDGLCGGSPSSSYTSSVLGNGGPQLWLHRQCPYL